MIEMCGVAGIFDPLGNIDRLRIDTVAGEMADTMIHRGPDDRGTWADLTHGVALGFRRLSILDLTQDGHQPMTSPSGRYVIVFNGEIYNHEYVRSQIGTMDTDYLIGGRSDTSTMLMAFERWGIREAVKKFTGMFAFAVWDRDTNSLTLGRDRIGEKPMYYGWAGHASFGFSSELKAFRLHPLFRPKINSIAVNAFFRRGFIPAPASIFDGIYKLIPGTLLTITAEQIQRSILPEPSAYWSLADVAHEGVRARIQRDSREVEQEFDRLLSKVIRREMISDVPLGAFLSGGVDSSLIVALMQANSGARVKTFSIGFENEQFNEAPFASAVARHLGTDHTEQYVSDQDARAVIPQLPGMYDEPFADPSQIPTYLVSRIARSSVTVSLTGDGGDEMFGGYNSYLILEQIWKKLQLMPLPLRRQMPRLLDWARTFPNQGLLVSVASRVPGISTAMTDANRIYRLAPHLHGATTLLSLYEAFVSSSWSPLSEPYRLPNLSGQTRRPDPELLGVMSDVESLMFWDAVGALPDGMLVKVDRASMATSLETRAPLLDHEIVEFSWRLPSDQKVRSGKGKHILRETLDRYVPRELIERPKRGFGIPMRDWLTGPLQSWAEDLLCPSTVRAYGVLDADRVSDMWSSYKQNGWVSNREVWSTIVMQSWLAHHASVDSAGLASMTTADHP